MAMVTIRLSDELKARIDNLAKQSGRPKSYFVRELIIRGIEEFEEDLRDLEAIREYLAAGGRNQKMISMKDLSIELGLDNLHFIRHLCLGTGVYGQRGAGQLLA